MTTSTSKEAGARDVGEIPEHMTDAEILQWIDACNHEPAKATLRHYLYLRSERLSLGVTKEWFEAKAALEGDMEIGVGHQMRSPPAYNNCTCSCHRGSGIIHFVACCAPDRKAEGTTP